MEAAAVEDPFSAEFLWEQKPIHAGKLELYNQFDGKVPDALLDEILLGSNLQEVTDDFDPMEVETTDRTPSEMSLQEKSPQGSVNFKTNDQLKTLMELFKDQTGVVPSALKSQAKRATGLPWKKIYKWLFDSRQKNPHFRRTQKEYGLQLSIQAAQQGADSTKP